jgi:hypothetical protein
MQLLVVGSPPPRPADPGPAAQHHRETPSSGDLPDGTMTEPNVANMALGRAERHQYDLRIDTQHGSCIV